MSSRTYLTTTTSAAPLAIFRIGFGLMMLVSIIRFWANGWIVKLYLEPKLFFSYFGFEWVHPLGIYTYLIFLICGISCIGIIIGYRYRWAMLLFFFSFTYIELMDKTTYLNHYYFVSVLSFLMIFIPSGCYFSIDSHRKGINCQHVPRWTVDSLKLLISIVYIYAGIAKINSDWLLHAAPLNIWLPLKSDLPLIGSLLQETWVHYAFSWSGILYDLCIPFLLLWRPTRLIGFVLVIIFHMLTKWLFPSIGMFPYIMAINALIFFDMKYHQRVIDWTRDIFCIKVLPITHYYLSRWYSRLCYGILIVFFAFQLLFPWRYLLYPGELFWTEEGYRFSWRVMLMEKAGYASFKIVNIYDKTAFYVDNTAFLTVFQEKQMATQPDLILQYAHYLGHYFSKKFQHPVAVYVDSYVALNGRPSRRYVNPNTNLFNYPTSYKQHTFILNFDDEISGF